MIFSIIVRKKYLYGAFKIIFSPETFSTSLGHTGDNLERRFRRHLGGRVRLQGCASSYNSVTFVLLVLQKIIIFVSFLDVSGTQPAVLSHRIDVRSI